MYYFGYQNVPVNGRSKIKQYMANNPYVVSSSDNFVGSVDLAHNIISDLIFNSDGTKMYLSQSIGFIYEYELAAPYDITSGTLITTLDLTSFYGTIGSSPWWPSSNNTAGPWLSGISWNDDGSKLYVSNVYGSTLQSKVNGTVNPATVTGDGGTRTNTMPVIELRVQ